ncbi:MAG: peptide ABC transporter permease [Piscirickettsiaceae bacterium CG_4_9_14_3_um_filter_43_564]|nr:ABC transporter permease [Thiomicrospira sp.]OIP94335.1 MAG: peptide ABC transporter permease [Thiomicrospira sp. CG2_30_44_34]PIQ02579.1 MAG: peptide ABC transporter permease [Piscirickettsiaceae bacterium CG18_big_fil_WC_8_21_14_2_50_44_103]PIU39554.1 MAG: peptide ABC transporter permease [Piscirickettsiaceae bacterium CG07_land_8_20_14_0_80_44_28]PIW57577.1 MAG: peptide ABC transporter permease [Piscirickettsiaceae bacterium CG12_big_fil_rev_8_21_14_0_65_44_934]PIW77861.1 MAG: peptide AB
MLTYIIRRLVFAVPILIGVNLITFALFFMVNTPDDMARSQLGAKQTSAEMIAAWKQQKGYDKPLFYNEKQPGLAKFYDTLYVQESLKLFWFDFGQADDGRQISADIQQRMAPSLAIAIPTFVIGLVTNIAFALLIVLFRGSVLDTATMVVAVAIMSISGLFYIIAGQVLFSKLWHWVPISGYAEGWDSIKFMILPVMIGVFAGLGAGIRWYRSLFLEEIHKDYVRTARAKGLSEIKVLFGHVLQNGLLPILTGVVVVIPTLFMGSLIMESFFGIPGLGSYTIDAINAQDFGIVKAMVFLGSVLYIVGLILTDISYTYFDPRVRLTA